MPPLYSFGKDDQHEVQHNHFGHVMSLSSASHYNNDTGHWYQNWYQHWHKSHIMPLNNCLYIINIMLSLVAPSASCDRKHAIVMYMQKLSCSSNVANKWQLWIRSCAHETTLSVYMLLMNPKQSTMWQETLVYIYFKLLAYAPKQICPPQQTFVPLHYYCGLHIDPTLLHIQVQKNYNF